MSEMSDNVKTQLKPIEDLAAELAVDVEALEDRLEMIGIDAIACCVINGGACSVAPPK